MTQPEQATQQQGATVFGPCPGHSHIQAMRVHVLVVALWHMEAHHNKCMEVGFSSMLQHIMFVKRVEYDVVGTQQKLEH